MNDSEKILAFAIGLFLAVLVNVGIFCLFGTAVAYLWNTFSGSEVLVTWWQAALGLLCIRVLIGWIRS